MHIQFRQHSVPVIVLSCPIYLNAVVVKFRPRVNQVLYLTATLPMLIPPLMASCIYTGQAQYDYAGQAQRPPGTVAASTCYFTHAHSMHYVHVYTSHKFGASLKCL